MQLARAPVSELLRVGRWVRSLGTLFSDLVDVASSGISRHRSTSQVHRQAGASLAASQESAEIPADLLTSELRRDVGRRAVRCPLRAVGLP